MFNLIKPGHILRFGTDPATIISPPGVLSQGQNNNKLATPWPNTRNLGLVQCFSHPSGAIGDIAADVVAHLRKSPASNSRSMSYSTVGSALSASDRPVGSMTCDFVGYVDGQSNYIKSAATVFSKDFSGCIMVAYTIAGQRHVAHAAANSNPDMDCKQPFLNTIKAQGATLNGWFKPFVSDRDLDRKLDTFDVVKKYVRGSIDALTTFGVITQSGQAYSLEAFQPSKVATLKAGDFRVAPVTIIGKGAWVVTAIIPRVMSPLWTCR